MSFFNFKGTVLIVFTLLVISSPTIPSPLVDAEISSPCSYVSDTDNPSILSSQTYSGLIPSFFILASNYLISDSLNTLLSDIIGIL